jgi:DNA-binding Lrp family transcriptional regulator
MAKVELDEIDNKILREYLRDARLSYREVARRVRVAVGTVMARTKRLEAEGVIKSYTATLDHEKLGYYLTAVTEITVSKGKLVEMEREIAKIPVACAVYDVTGLTDALIIAKFRSREELSDFTKALLAMPFVERTNTHIVLTTVKEDFRLQP